jgi:RNA polymerase sigma factor for flagellar operon FliA
LERDRIVLENLPLVGYLVSEVASKMSDLSHEDLASVGTLALISCAESYDASTGVPFGSFARRRIIGAFADEMRSQDWATRTARRRMKETSAIRETLTGALGRTPTVTEMADALGVDSKDVSLALSDASRSVSVLDETVAETLVATTGSPEAALLVAEQSHFVSQCIESLPPKMRFIVNAVYFEDRTVKELAEELGSTHSAVSQQRTEAIKMLRAAMSTHYSASVSDAGDSESRANEPRRAAYLSNVAERTVGGITRFGPVKTPVAVVA